MTTKIIQITSFPDYNPYERREALSAIKAFTELMSPGAEFKCDDANLDGDPGTAEYGGKDGIPEKMGRERVKKLFEGEAENCLVREHELF